MEAMQLNAELLYSPYWFATSIVIAVALGILAMSTYSRSNTIRGAKSELRKIQFVTALIIAAAISGMHYVAMLAARFYANETTSSLTTGAQHQHLWLIYAIVIAVALIALISWVSSVIDRRFQHNYRAIRQSDKRIRELAFNDALTGLPNRRSLLDYLSQQQQEIPEDEHLVLFLLDIDKFKVLNNTLGPTLGDLLLQSVTHRLERVNLNVHMVARPSSNEFAVVARVHKSNNPVQAQSHALSMAKTLQQELQAPYSLKDYRHQCSMSLGATVISDLTKSSEDILVQAALALAEAKRNGMGEIRLYHPEMADAIEKRVKLESDLRHAIETRTGLELYVQPQLNENRTVIGAEALIRWHHSERGMVSPAEFIPLAEETGLIIGLGDLINEQACQIIRQWQQLGLNDWVLSINVSAPQFQQLDFVDKLNSLLKHYEVPAGQLKLELTESVLMQNLDEVIHKINELKQLGIQFALDDFGTGYSSLSYLMKLPFDVLKIDVSFVRDMFQSKQKEAIVQTIVQLAHNLGLKVVAEGVETEKHFDYLSSLGCDYFQGYLFSKPVAEPEFRQQNQ
jgi:diguanylate cyclase (GGDEF)-like protein